MEFIVLKRVVILRLYILCGCVGVRRWGRGVWRKVKVEIIMWWNMILFIRIIFLFIDRRLE